MIKTLLKTACSLPLLIALAACGGGSSASTPTYTNATVKIAIAGALPAGTNISGVGVTVTLPAGVTIATDISGAVAAGAVTPSGIFATGTQTAPIYTAANGANQATLKLGMASGTVAGENQAGEIATVVFNLASGTVPTSADFSLSDLVVVNATTYNSIPGFSGSVTSVILQ